MHENIFGIKTEIIMFFGTAIKYVLLSEIAYIYPSEGCRISLGAIIRMFAAAQAPAEQRRERAMPTRGITRICMLEFVLLSFK